MKASLKKALALLLALCMLLAATACAKKGDSEESKSNNVVDTAGNGDFVYADAAPDRDYGGAEFRILCTTQTQQFFDDSSHIDAVRSAVVKRNQTVSELFNVQIKYTAEDGNGANEVGFATSVRNACLAGSAEDTYDLVIPQSYYGVALGIEGLYYNFNKSEYLMRDREWYYQSINDQCEIEGQTYFLATTFLMDKTTAAEVVYYNVDLGEEYGIDEEKIYDEVIAGDWTVDKLKIYAENAAGNDGIKGVVSSTHGIRGMMIGCDTPFTEKDSNGQYQITYYNDHLIDVFNKVFSFFNGNSYIEAKDLDMNLNMFPDGDSIFAITYVHSMLESNNLDSAVDFTVLPMPKFSDTQENYITDVQRWELVSVPVSANTERACIVLDALSYYNNEELLPVYWESLLGVRFARNEKASRIVDIIRNSICYDFTAVFQLETKKIYAGSSGMPNAATLILNGQNELASWWGEYGSMFPELVESLRLKYSELAEAKDGSR